jgi:hypothetical protein
MLLDDQLRHYFGTDDVAAVPPAALAAGIERIRVDFGLQKDRDRRFALGRCCTCWAQPRIWTSPSRTKRIATQRAASWN